LEITELVNIKEMKQKVYKLLNENKYFIKFIYSLIIINVILLILQSYQELDDRFSFFFETFEFFSVVIFSIEYILRMYSSQLSPRYHASNSIFSGLKFSISTFGIIDLLAILPFYLPLFFPFDLRVLRILRLFRLLRIFKIGRYSKSLKTITDVLRETKSELVITIFVAFILLILSSSLMYYIENEAQPEQFKSIGHSFWWAVATLTTVGYGDVYPITGLGKVIGSIIALIGIGFVALPTGIISSAFIGKVQEEKAKKEAQKTQCKCPNCGTEIN